MEKADDIRSAIDPCEGVERLTTCSTAGPMFVSVKDDRIVRIEPMEFKEDEVKSWSVNSCGKEYKPTLTHPLLPWGYAGKQDGLWRGAPEIPPQTCRLGSPR